MENKNEDSWYKFKNKRIYTPHKKIGIWRSIGFGVTDVWGGGSLAIIGSWLLFFYTTYAGLSATEGASILAIARFVDAFSSLFMGNLTDEFYRTKLGRRFGRRHFFMMIGAPLTFVFALQWVVGMSYWYYLFSYLGFEIVAAMISIPWETLPNEMTSDYNSRTKMTSVRLFISGVATFLATFIPGQLFRVMGQNSAFPYLVNGLLFSFAFMACVFISWGSTWERFIDRQEATRLEAGEEHFTLKNALGDYFSTLRIKSFRQHLAIYLCSFTANDVWGSVFVYYIVSVVHSSSTVAANIQSLSLFGLPITLLCGYLITKISPRSLYVTAYTIIICSCLGWFFIWELGPHNLIFWLVTVGLIYQVGKAGLTFTPWNVFPFIPDLDELVTGKRRAGVFAAVMTFVRKSTVAVATFIVGILLDESGYVKGQIAQPLGAQRMIVGIFVIGVSILLLAAMFFAVRFKLNKETHRVIVSEIVRLRNGGSQADATEETKRVCKELTGIDYKNIKGWDSFKKGDQNEKD